MLAAQMFNSTMSVSRDTAKVGDRSKAPVVKRTSRRSPEPQVRVRLPAGAREWQKILELPTVFQPSAASGKNSWQILGRFGRVSAANGGKFRIALKSSSRSSGRAGSLWASLHPP
jgi:hypothetical protein